MNIATVADTLFGHYIMTQQHNINRAVNEFQVYAKDLGLDEKQWKRISNRVIFRHKDWLEMCPDHRMDITHTGDVKEFEKLFSATKKFFLDKNTYRVSIRTMFVDPVKDGTITFREGFARPKSFCIPELLETVHRGQFMPTLQLIPDEVTEEQLAEMIRDKGNKDIFGPDVRYNVIGTLIIPDHPSNEPVNRAY